MYDDWDIENLVESNCITLGTVRDLRKGEQLQIFNIDRNWLDTGIFEFYDENDPLSKFSRTVPLPTLQIANHVKGKGDVYTHSHEQKGSVHWWWQRHEHEGLDFEWQLSYAPGRWFPLWNGKFPAEWMIDEGITPPEHLDARDWPDSTPCGWRGPSVEIYKMLSIFKETAAKGQSKQQIFSSNVQRTREKFVPTVVDYRYEVLRTHPSMAKYYNHGLGKVLCSKLRNLLSSPPRALEGHPRRMRHELPNLIFPDDIFQLARTMPLTADYFQHHRKTRIIRVLGFTEGWRAPWSDGAGIPLHIRKACWEPLSRIYWALRSIEDQIVTTDVPEEVLLFTHGSKENSRNIAVRVRLQVRTPSGTYVPVKKLAELNPSAEIGIIDGPAALMSDVLEQFEDAFFH